MQTLNRCCCCCLNRRPRRYSRITIKTALIHHKLALSRLPFLAVQSILACVLILSSNNGPLVVAGQGSHQLSASPPSSGSANQNHKQHTHQHHHQAPLNEPHPGRPSPEPPVAGTWSLISDNDEGAAAGQAVPPLGSSPRVATRASGAGAAGLLLLAEPPESNRLDPARPIDSTLANVLDHVGPDMRPTGGFKDPADVSLEVSQRAWQMMHEHALKAARERIDFLWPIVEQILHDSNVSSGCLRASQRLARAARHLDSWSIQLLNSWGSFPPAGLFEGTFGDIGSYHGCVNVPQNELIGHAHYCTIAYKPVMPTRRDYELIVRKEPDGLLELFDRPKNQFKNSNSSTTPTTLTTSNAFTDLISQAQYSHYIYYKVGTCFPIDCTPIDVQQIARFLGQRATLISGPVKCHSKFSQDYDHVQYRGLKVNHEQTSRKLELSSRDLNGGIYIWKPHMTTTQLVALIIVCSLVGFILILTVVDFILNFKPTLLNQPTDRGPETRPQKGTKTDKPTRQWAEQHLEDPNNNVKSDRIVSPPNGEKEKKFHHVECLEMLSIPSKGSCNCQPAGNKLNATNGHTSRAKSERTRSPNDLSPMMQLINDCSLITNTREFFLAGTNGQRNTSNEILCINGLRCVTMSWIIVAHTMQYNDWSAFARTHEIETHLRSLINQPLFNASYLVDTFFLISGLLTSFSAFRVNHNDTKPAPPPPSPAPPGNIQQILHPSIKQILGKFSCKNYLIGRYLRLTPQILLVSLLFILLPLLKPAGGPHWYTMTGEYSENCSKNWWINLLHIQAFYKPNEMCNFVCWWISVDMFYHLMGLFMILFLFKFGHKISTKFYSITMLTLSVWQASQHYQMKLPPNLLSTIPQTGAMWSQMTLNYFWRPEAHTFPFLFGFYLGYLMAQHGDLLEGWFSPKRALVGWSMAIVALVSVSYGTYYWVLGIWSYSSKIATTFYLTSQILWSLSLAWIIVACHFNHGNFINQILSCRLFIILGRASYVVYLSHFLVLFTFFGSQNLLLEPTQVLMLYVILGNVCLSMLFGSILCISFEMPWLKLQRKLMRKLR